MSEAALAPAAAETGAQNAGPLVMAYIGEDDPHRGDSKAAAGLARLVAEMTRGRYVYVDKAMLDGLFSGSLYDKLQKYSSTIGGGPDIMIGSNSALDVDAFPKRPVLTISSINEVIQGRVTQGVCELVPHHLTKEILADARTRFQEVFPDVKGPLVAVMMGGRFRSEEELAEKLVKIARNYPEITFFLCPSRRTGMSAPVLAEALERKIRRLQEGNGVFADQQTPYNGKITILDAEYGAAIAANGFNPYLGLLGRADHIVVAGESYSLVSEALFTGKNIYLFKEGHAYKGLHNKGYVQKVAALDENQPFPTRPMEPLDLTRDVAASIVEEYNEACASPPSKKPESGAWMTAIQDIIKAGTYLNPNDTFAGFQKLSAPILFKYSESINDILPKTKISLKEIFTEFDKKDMKLLNDIEKNPEETLSFMFKNPALPAHDDDHGILMYLYHELGHALPDKNGKPPGP
jgi:hypothetical protein